MTSFVKRKFPLKTNTLDSASSTCTHSGEKLLDFSVHAETDCGDEAGILDSASTRDTHSCAKILDFSIDVKMDYEIEAGTLDSISSMNARSCVDRCSAFFKRSLNTDIVPVSQFART